MSDDSMPAWAEGMEHRIITEVSKHIAGLRGELRDLGTGQETLRRIVASVPGTVLDAVQDPSPMSHRAELRRIRGVEKRLDDLEGGE